MLYRFSDYHPIFFDQPFAYNDLIPAAQIQDSLTAPLGLNCAVDSKQAISIAADLGAAEIIGINPQQCGGLIASKQRLTDCRNLNLSSRIWNRLTSPLGTRQLLSLAWQAKDSLINKFTGSCGVNCYPIPYWNASDWFEQNLFEPDFPSDSDSGKVIKPWSEPGLGIDPDEDLLEDFTEQKFEIS